MALVLVDAYNALHRLLGDPPEDRDESRRLLVAWSQEAGARHRPRGGRAERVHLVFDTWPGAVRRGERSSAGKVSWLYAEGSADEEIVRQVRDGKARMGSRRITVVTDDRELAGRVRQLGATVLGVKAFYGEVALPGDGVAPPRAVRGQRLPPIDASDFDLPAGPIDLTGPDAREP